MADIIHKPSRQSIYDRTDYIVNSDMSIPFALARSGIQQAQVEAARRVGLPPEDRRPMRSSLTLNAPRLTKGR